MGLVVPLCFRSSCQSVLRHITNFGNGALVKIDYRHSVRWSKAREAQRASFSPLTAEQRWNVAMAFNDVDDFKNVADVMEENDVGPVWMTAQTLV